MEVNFGKFFLAAAGGLVGAIAGAALAGWRAAGAVAQAGARAEDVDAAAQASPLVLGPAVAGVFKGGLIGGIIGVVIAIAALYYFDTERVRIERKFKDLGD